MTNWGAAVGAREAAEAGGDEPADVDAGGTAAWFEKDEGAGGRV